MPIVVDVDVMLAKRKMSVGELAQRGDHTGQPRRAQERPRQGRALHHARARLCEVLECQPGDLLRWEPEDS